MISKFRLQNMSVWGRLAFSSGLLIVLLLALATYAGLQLRGNQNHFFLFAAAVLVLGVASASLITRSITRQLGGELTDAANLARDIATGNFKNVYKERKRDENSLMGSLLKMRSGLQQRRQHLYEAVQHLADSSGQLSASSKSLEATLNEQAASTNEVEVSRCQGDHILLRLNHNIAQDGHRGLGPNNVEHLGEAVGEMIAVDFEFHGDDALAG